MSNAWQHPHVSLFKVFGVGQWKKCSKEGDVSSMMDRDIKSTVFRVLGSIPAANYIQIPKTSSQSLSLTGQYLYAIFKPLPGKYFVLHLETVNSSGMVIRLSFSNLFKEFKSTSTWLQFPFACNSDKENNPKVTDTIPTSLRWTLLKINLKAILSKYLHTQYSYLKNVKICANLLVKNIFTSEFDYSPFTFDSSKFAQPLPREIALPLTKDEKFSDKYDYMQYPYEPNENGSSSQRSSTRKLKGMHPQVSVLPSMSSEMRAEPDRGTTSPDKTARQEHTGTREGKTLPKSQPNFESRVLRLKPRSSKEAPEIVSLKSTATEKVGRTVRSTPRAGRVLKSQQQRTKKLSGGAVRSEQELEELHVYTEGGGGVVVHREGSRKSVIVKGMKQEFQSLQPDPILRLNKVIGFGGHGTGQLLFGRDGESVFYPCHCLVIAMEIKTGEQKFYIGHTDKVSCIALNHSGSLLASGQSGPLPLVRLWGVESARCLALFKTHSSGLHSLSFSHSGGVLCGVGRDGHGKGQVVLWGTAQAPRTGDVSVLAKAHTDAGIDHMRIASFDDSRMVSCGWDNVRFWRLKGGSLRSCPVNLEKHHQMHFTDVQFQPGFHNESDLTDRSVFASTKTGHIFEIHYKSISVKRKWHVLPSNPGGVPILSLAVHEGFCVTGSEDGVLRVWPLDFSARLMEAEHDGPVSAVDISEDGLRILAGTTAGNIGLLDASSSSYSTLMRSHREVVQCMSVTGSEVAEICLVSCSLDHTIRVWDSRSGKQLFDFHTPGDIGCAVAWHPSLPVFACGFKSGVVRLFHVPSTTVLSEHKSHNGVITGVVFSPSGHALYSSSSTGSLAMYDLSDISAAKVIRVLANTVAKGEVYGPRALSVSQGGQRLAFIGPLDSTVSVLDAESLDEVLRLDITPMSTHHSTTATPNPALETAKMVTFSHKALNQLLVITSTSRLLKFSASNGQLLSEVAHIHRTSCTAVCPSNTHLLTAGDNVLKVWDYGMALDLNFQVFIGHSEPITEVLFSPNGDQVVSCGDAIFLWDFLGYTPPTFTPPHSPCKPLPRSVSPRRSAPAPVNYEPIKMHSFTPLAPTSKHKPLTGNTSRRQASTTALIDDDTLYEPHIVSQSPDHSSDNQEGPDNRLGADQEENINVFKKRNFEDQDSESGSEDVPMQQDKDDGQCVHPSPSPPPYSPPHTLPSPASHSHYHHHPPKATLAEHLYVAPPNQAGLIRQKVLGVNGAARNNVIWEPNSGLFVYSSGCIVVMEDLSTGKQTHMLGHTEEVSTLAAQHDVRDIASASPAFGHTPCEIRIWRVGSAKCTKVLTVHSHSVQSMAFSKDDRLLLSVGTYLDGTLAVWSTHDYSLLTATTLDHHVHQAGWDPHTAYELTSVGEGLRFWLVEEDRSNRTCELKVHEPELPAEVVKTSSRSNLEFTSLCYGADSMLFIGTNTGVITLWETKGNKCLMYWTTDLLEVTTLFSSAGRLFSADVAGCMHLWSVEGGQPLPTVSLLNSMHVPGGVFSASFDSKLELGIVGTSSGTVHYVNWPDTTKVSIVSGHSSKISSLDITRDNSLLATASTDGSVAVWRMDSLEQTVLFQAPRTACNCVAFAPINEQGQGKTSPSVVAGYSDGMLRVFDLESLKMSRKMKPHLENVRAVAYSEDGHVIISGCSSGVVAISNSASGLVVRVITDHQGAPITDIHIAIKPAKLPDPGADECYLWLVASGDRRVSVWSSEWSKDRCQLVDWLTFPGPFFAPNGTRLKKGDKCQYELLPPSLARFSPSNPDTIVYTGYGMERCVQFYSISKKTVTRNCSLTHWATSMDLSPDGHLVAIGCEERVLKLMDSDEGAFQDYTGHHDSVDRINFSPNGKQLISASSNSLHIWDITL